MNGIEILETWTERALPLFNIVLGTIFELILIIFIIISSIHIIKATKEQKSIIAYILRIVMPLVCIGTFVFVGWLSHYAFDSYNTIETYHKIKIDESVSFKEVYDNYELIKENFDIWTVKERK